MKKSRLLGAMRTFATSLGQYKKQLWHIGLFGWFSIVIVVPAHAIPITIGALTTNDDGTTDIINDSLNNLEWLRLDVLKDLTYQQTLDAIGAGGVFEGWQIAHNAEAQMFVNAMYDPASNGCTTTVGFELCGTYLDADGALGDNWSEFADYGIFLSDNGIGHEAGILEINAGMGKVWKYNEWGTIDFSDRYSTDGGDTPMSWLLYRTSPAPAPNILGLLSMGLLGVGAATKRRNRKH